MAAQKGANRDRVYRLLVVPERRAEKPKKKKKKKKKNEYANADANSPPEYWYLSVA